MINPRSIILDAPCKRQSPADHGSEDLSCRHSTDPCHLRVDEVDMRLHRKPLRIISIDQCSHPRSFVDDQSHLNSKAPINNGLNSVSHSPPVIYQHIRLSSEIYLLTSTNPRYTAPVPYTHLTLPTNREVEVVGVAE